MDKKLKTLKDIKKKFVSNAAKTALGVARAEAIKWVKEKLLFSDKEPEWFEFFNISEEDLK